MTTATLTLTLHPTPAAVREPAAWFVPGPDPADWLAEVGRWGVPTADLRLYVVPASAADRSAVGVLVVSPAGIAPSGPPRRGQPYGLIAGKLYLPVASALWPPAGDDELRDLLRLPVQVFHPSSGLVGFADEDALHVHDLLAPPAGRDVDWGRAVPGESVRPRVVAVGPLEPPDLAGILEQGRGDIGSADLAGLPRTPDESAVAEAAKRLGTTPARLAEAAGMGAARFLVWVQKRLSAAGRAVSGSNSGSGRVAGAGAGGADAEPDAAGGKGWAERLHDWMAARFTRVNQTLQDQRAREIERLRRMLDRDPDEGLRHAIALRDVGGRGRALPSGTLGNRDVRFDLSSALGGGGGRTDGWDVPPDAVAALTRQYREAANRELRLGRHRRAAYVFAELLGDYAAAANALEQGRHFREAAALYRDKLANPAKAAECLEHGGLLVEAAAAYEDLKRFEKAGDLYAKVDRPDEATRCYRAEVDAHLARHDVPAAARLLEGKLAAPGEALAALTAAWPADDAAGTCLRASFDLLGRLARHGEAAARVAALRQAPPPTGREVVLTQALAAVATGYPEQAVRTAGADATRVVAAGLLPSCAETDRMPIARAVGKLAPEDRLLARDVERFLAKPAARPKPPTTPAVRGPVVVRRFNIGSADWSWRRAVVTGAGFCAWGGSSGPGAIFARGRWDGVFQTDLWRIADFGGRPEELELHPIAESARLYATPPIRRGTIFKLAPTDALPSTLEVTRPPWLPDETLAIGNNERGVTWALTADPYGSPVMKAYQSADGRLIASHGMQGVELPADPPTRLVARHDVVFAAWGSGVLRFIPVVETHVEPTASPARRLAISPPHGRLRVAAGLAEGGLLLWHDRRAQSFAHGLTDPHVAFTRGGTLVAADRQAGRVYRIDAGDLRHALDFGGVGEDVVTVTPTDHHAQFATFTAGGQVTVYQLPA